MLLILFYRCHYGYVGQTMDERNHIRTLSGMLIQNTTIRLSVI